VAVRICVLTASWSCAQSIDQNPELPFRSPRHCRRSKVISCIPNIKLTNPRARQVLAATNHLHGAIAELRGRVRDLESSLNRLHLTRVGTTHPLLTNQVDDEVDEYDESSHPLAVERLASNTFSLAIADDTSLKYFGHTSGAFVQSTQARCGQFCLADERLMYFRSSHKQDFRT
jgi:hypothetical protein